MPSLVRRLFRRYVDQHRGIVRSSRVLRDSTGQVLAERAEVAIIGDRVRVRIRPPAGRASQPLSIIDATGCSAPLLPDAEGTGWLTATVPSHWSGLQLRSQADGAFAALPMPRWIDRARTAALAPGFAGRLLLVLPRTWSWLHSRDPHARLMVLDALGLSSPRPPLLDGRVFGEATAATGAPPPQSVTIILPVYNAFALLEETIARIEANTDLNWHLVAIEDASTDDRLRPWLRARLAELASEQVTLIENAENLGFIGSVNLGLGLALRRGDPVVLLNSDAFLPQGWASRLVAPLADPTVASVTPMSNDAELMTVPAISSPRPLAPGQGDALDRIAAGFAAGAGLVEVPAGVGFCMAISPRWLAQVPSFDPVFGRGYGEEVDWCQKVRALGGRHMGLPGLFVEHRGGASFGSDAKRAALARSSELLAQRHPGFPERVRAFAAADPLATARLALATAWAGGKAVDGLAVYVAHSLGGGAELWLRDRISRHLQDTRDGSAMVLRLGGVQRWRLELHVADGPVVTGATDDPTTVASILHRAPRLHIVYSCAVGDPDPVALPDFLDSLVRQRDALDMVFHDFFPLSPSYTLLDSADRFHGVPGDDADDPVHQASRPDGSVVTLRQWRQAWGRLATRAERLIVFSTDSKHHVSAVWPQVAARIAVQPHELHTPVPAIAPPRQGQPFNIAVLGNINRHKGIAIVAAMAHRLAEIPDGPALTIIGKADPTFPLPASITVTGPYVLADLDMLARRHGVGAWIIPSIWPETFSYTTHEALATGLPVVGLGLGAQADALACHPNGHVIAWDEPAVMVQGLVNAVMVLRLGRPPTVEAGPCSSPIR